MRAGVNLCCKNSVNLERAGKKTREKRNAHITQATRSTMEGEREYNKFVPVLGGDGTKRSPTGDIFD